MSNSRKSVQVGALSADSVSTWNVTPYLMGCHYTQMNTLLDGTSTWSMTMTKLHRHGRECYFIASPEGGTQAERRKSWKYVNSKYYETGK